MEIKRPELPDKAEHEPEAFEHPDAALSETKVASNLESKTDRHSSLIPPPPVPVAFKLRSVLKEILSSHDVATLSRPTIPGYQILRELGRGGMGVVYEAIELRINRKVAIKVIVAGAHADANTRERLQLEAEAVARLQHPNIVQIFATGMVDGLPYLAFELVDGGRLSESIYSTNYTEREVAECMVTLANAIEYAHSQSVLHRDLKPSNVLLTRDGHPKIADFGLAKILGGGRSSPATDLTHCRALGTPCYMAPEQIENRGQAFGPEVDVWGLGAIMYEFLTRSPPFRGATAEETFRRTLAEDLVPLRTLHRGLSRDLEVICLKCLAKNPLRRYRTVSELEADLQRFLDHKPIFARPNSSWERGIKWSQRHPLFSVAAFSTVLLVAAISGAGWYVASRERSHIRALESERSEKNKYFEHVIADVQRLKDLSDALAKSDITEVLPQGEYRREIQEERLRVYRESLEFKSLDPLVLSEKGNTFERMSDIYHDLGRDDEALAAQREGVRLHGALLLKNPTDYQQTAEYAQALDRLGLLLRNSGKNSEAESAQREAIEIARRGVAGDSESAMCHSVLGTSLNNLATNILASHNPQRLNEARDALREAIVAQKRALELKPSIIYRRFLRNHHGALAETLLRLGEYQEAASYARVLPSFFPDQYRDYNYAAAFLKRCGEAVRMDESRSPVQQESEGRDFDIEAERFTAEANRIKTRY